MSHTCVCQVTGAHAEALAALCPMRVFDVEDGAAVVARPRDCTLCRCGGRHARAPRSGGVCVCGGGGV